MEDRKRFHLRSNILVVAFLACLFGFICILYNAQVVHGKDYLDYNGKRKGGERFYQGYPCHKLQIIAAGVSIPCCPLWCPCMKAAAGVLFFP